MKPTMVYGAIGDDPAQASLYYGLNVLDALRLLPDDSVNVIATSPPYWSLRDYGVPQQAWGGSETCEHEWGDEIQTKQQTGGTNPKTSTLGAKSCGNTVSDEGIVRSQVRSHVKAHASALCKLCGAWRGCLGLEPTPDLFVEHLVLIAREARRVLHPTGTFWLNLGDSVGHDTPMLYRVAGKVHSGTMGDLCDRWMAQEPSRVLRQADGAEILSLSENDRLQVVSVADIRRARRSEAGSVHGQIAWRSVASLIRKPSRKPMVRSQIGNRWITTTTDHSFITNTGASAKPEVGLVGVGVNGYCTTNPDVEMLAIPTSGINLAFAESDAIREGLADDVVLLTGKTHSRVRVPSQIPLTDDLLRFFGLWLGDGSYDQGTVSIASGYENVALHTCQAVANMVGGTLSMASDGVSLRLVGAIWVRCMRALGFQGHSHTKNIPAWVLNLSCHQIGVLLSGYLYADGHFHKSKVADHKVSFSTRSPALFRGLVDLFFLCGYEIRRTHCKGGGYDTTGGVSLVGVLRSAHVRRWMAEFGIGGRTQDVPAAKHTVGGLSEMRVTAIEPVEYDHPYVYDLSVPGTEKFVCDGVVLHNSYMSHAAKEYTNLGGFEGDRQREDEGYKDAIVIGKPTVGGLKDKDLVGVPWRAALALQRDGWWLRNSIIWEKSNAMPSSVQDRFSCKYEYVFLLTKAAQYFFDLDAVKVPHTYGIYNDEGDFEPAQNWFETGEGTHKMDQTDGELGPLAGSPRRVGRGLFNINGKNPGDHWRMATAGYRGTHFAAWPENLVERMVKAGCSEKGRCPHCQTPWGRIVEKTKEGSIKNEGTGHNLTGDRIGDDITQYDRLKIEGATVVTPGTRKTVGWAPLCDCPEHKPERCVVMDLFSGSGTTGVVTMREGHNYVGLDLQPDYLDLAVARLEGRKAPKPDDDEPDLIGDLFR